MNPERFRQGTKALALRVIHLTESLPQTESMGLLARQLLRSGTSVGANHRAACRAKSCADFISKLGNVEEERDESIYRMDLLVNSAKVKQSQLANLLKEANETLALVVA